MTKPTIRSYNDLLDEQARLELELLQQRVTIQHRWREVKDNISPVIRFLGFFKRLSETDKPSLLARGLNFALDLWVRKKLFRKAGWIKGMIGSSLLRRLTATLFSPMVWEQVTAAIKRFSTKQQANQKQATSESKPY